MRQGDAMKYDCTQDVELHRWSVTHYMKIVFLKLTTIIPAHDASKLQEPEKSIFDEWTPRLKEVEFGSDEYKAALAGMGDALKHHYENNRHHPEHFENGVTGMNLLDVIEMVCDWKAAAFMKGQTVNLDILQERFGLSDQLRSIIANTLEILDE
jgi:hypothetical protein